MHEAAGGVDAFSSPYLASRRIEPSYRIKQNGGQPQADIKQFRQAVRDQMEALTNLDDGGITPPLNFANHQGSVQARIAEIKAGKYVPTGNWINAN